MKRLWWVAVLVTIAFAICFTEIYAIKIAEILSQKLLKKAELLWKTRTMKRQKNLVKN